MAMTTAMCLDPEPAPGGTVVPKSEYASTIKMFASECWPTVRRIFEKQLAGSLLVAPSSFKDLKNEELRPLIDKYYRGSSGSAEERVKLFKLIWDAIGTEFGARHELYEINYSGNHEQVRMDVVNFSRRNHLVEQFTEMAESLHGRVRSGRLERFHLVLRRLRHLWSSRASGYLTTEKFHTAPAMAGACLGSFARSFS